MVVDPLARRRILAITTGALQAAGVDGLLPTPLAAVGQVAGIKEVIDIAEVPEELVAAKPRALGRILGAYLFRSETAFVDRSQSLPRTRYIQAHETIHRLLPWHRVSFLLDDGERLFRDAEEQLEAEANLGAAYLIFQGLRFNEQAMDYEDSINTPILLASSFGASLHAAIRHYAAHHPEPVAVICAGAIVRADGTVPIWSSDESPAFRRRHGRFLDHFPCGTLQVRAAIAQPTYARISAEALAGRLPAEDTIRLPAKDGSLERFRAEAFFNQRTLFLMVTPHRAVRRGRQVRLAG